MEHSASFLRVKKVSFHMQDYLASLAAFLRYGADIDLMGRSMYVVKSRSDACFLSSSARSAAQALDIFKMHQEMGLTDTTCLIDNDYAIAVVSYDELERNAGVDATSTP